LADVSDDSNRAKHFGLMGAGFGLGFILGPAVGGLVAAHGLMYPFIAAAILNLLNFLFGLFVLPESLSPVLRRNFSLTELNPFQSLKGILSMPSINLLVIAHIFLALAGQTHPSMWAIYTEYRFSWTPAQVGMSLAAVGLFSALAQGGLTGFLVKRFGERKLSLWGSLGEALTFAGYGLATVGWMVYPVLAVASVFSAAQPALQSLITREVPADRQGELQGALMSLMSLMGVINPLIMTRLFAFSSGHESLIDMPGLVYYFAAIFGLFAFVAVWRWESSHAMSES
jgi:DHA1 family tetracycline resistance protein-like MFS transporter